MPPGAPSSPCGWLLDTCQHQLLHQLQALKVGLAACTLTLTLQGHAAGLQVPSLCLYVTSSTSLRFDIKAHCQVSCFAMSWLIR